MAHLTFGVMTFKKAKTAKHFVYRLGIRENKVTQLMKMTDMVMAYRNGILTWCDYLTSTRKVERTNNKIKELKRTDYGFRDEEYFELRLYALHDCHITPNVG